MTTDTSLTGHIEIGDRQVYIEYVDHVGRGPTLLFEAGAGDGCSAWDDVFLDVAAFARVFRHDRPGLGQSDPVSQACTLHTTCDDLHSVLAKAVIPGPYVLVGHSFGGLAVCLYAHRYAGQARGLVLVDSSHPDTQARLGPLLPPETADESGNLSVLRKIFLASEVEFGNERIAWAASLAQGRSITSLGDMRLVVLTGRSTFAQMSDVPAELAGQLDRTWQTLQRDLLKLSSHSTQIIAEKSGHYIHRDQPQVVIDATRTMVDQVRDG
jgi:pimeloyl-ACP methyl ester carboxylesterase